jgi:hypothetical protein
MYIINSISFRKSYTERYAPFLSSVFQFEFRDENKNNFYQRTYFFSFFMILVIIFHSLSFNGIVVNEPYVSISQ